VFLIIFINKSQRSQKLIENSTINFSNPLRWQPEFFGNTNQRYNCNLYRFPSFNYNSNTNKKFTLGNPNKNIEIVNQLTPIPLNKNIVCLDIDEIILKQTTNICLPENPNLDFTNSINTCSSQNGGRSKINEKETFYDSSNCKKLPPCDGFLTLISIGSPGIKDISPSMCLSFDEQGNRLIMETCDPNNENQYFRISKQSIISGLPTTINLDGFSYLAQIIHRKTNKCLKSDLLDNYNINFNGNFYQNIFNCNNVNPPSSQSSTLYLENCDSYNLNSQEFSKNDFGLYKIKPSLGYDWFLSESTTLTDVSSGKTITTVPQIFYVKGLEISFENSFDEFVKNFKLDKNLKNLINSKLFQKIYQNYPSLYFNYTNGGGIPSLFIGAIGIYDPKNKNFNEQDIPCYNYGSISMLYKLSDFTNNYQKQTCLASNSIINSIFDICNRF
jgi:hypothetical protein